MTETLEPTETKPDPPFMLTQENINKSFRGKKRPAWLERAVDPSTPTLKDVGVVHTTSANARFDGMGAELLFTTV